MAEFVAVVWDARTSVLPETVNVIRQAALSNGWTEALSQPGLYIATGGAGSLDIQRPPHGRVIVIGTWTSQRSLLDAAAKDITPLGICRRLTASGWGRYVALTVNERNDVDGVYRDPSGSLDCFVQSSPQITLIVSSAPPWLVERLPIAWTPDWDRVADIVADPTLVSGVSALLGVEAVSPGDFLPLGVNAGGPIAVWRPASFVTARTSPIEEARRGLAAAIDGVVESRLRRIKSSLVEVSGGLDSAIVAAAVRTVGDPHSQTFVNYYGPYAEADERAYAQAVADLVGRSLTTIARDPPTDVARGWMDDRLSLRPGFNRLDPIYDASQATLCHALACSTVITGKGGDSVLFQPNTPLVFADLLQSLGVRAVVDPRLFSVARWTRHSIWSVVMKSCSGLQNARRAHHAAGRAPSVFAASGAVSTRSHPWLENLQGIPPAKRIQIAAIASNLSMHGPSLQTDVAEVFHPMLTQPVLEQALGIPTIDLVEGGRDRGLARIAYAGRIPESIRLRRTKGGLSQYFGLAIAHELDALRPFLLEGLLAQRGLLNRQALELALSRDALVWNGAYGDIMLLAMIEAWVRRWEAVSPGV